MADGVHEIEEAVLLEVSAVDEPAYPGAVITALRSRAAELDRLAGVTSLSRLLVTLASPYNSAFASLTSWR